MEYITHNQQNLGDKGYCWARNEYDVNGTYYQGFIGITADKITEKLGAPILPISGKTDAEWIVQFDDGTIASIYNYKNGRNFLGGKGKAIHEIRKWHIGGDDGMAVVRLAQVFNETDVIVLDK